MSGDAEKIFETAMHNQKVKKMRILPNEWTIVKELATMVAFGDSYNDKRRLFSYLSFLQKKYGDDANILATKADFLCSDKKAIVLLEKAYILALDANDHANCILIADSIMERYLNMKDILNTTRWMSTLRKIYKDTEVYSEQEYKELEKRFSQLKHSLGHPNKKR